MLNIDQYAYTNALRDVHPVEKAVFSFSLLLFSLWSKSVWVSTIIFFVMSAIIVRKAEIPLRYYVKLLFAPFFFLLTSVVVIIVSIVPIGKEAVDSLWQLELGVWKLSITSSNVIKSVGIVFPVIASVSCMYFIILTTPITQLIWLLQKLKVSSLFIELAVFTYHFIFVLLEKSREIYLAQSMRLGYQSYRTGFSSFGQLIVSLLIKTLRSAKEFQIALDCRGGEEALYDVEWTQVYKKTHWLGIALLLTGLFIIYMLTNK
ncbi:cobalt ECF transporter T component CbiQ [Bacillus sp. V3B]|uniref:cobalt ECF transporter T component CbiQ n=1 Tax=Bacillus sp. V3B TaxID=2804915 RepID=UPI00210B363D|nr:cobalt ECF transporter T component CbiQ [Bacillus sp. V3B]MCQ6274256.1 cobalt ECF transporter T component CbiQ [Bacillus sp. V3B]